MLSYGRKVIYTDVDEITAENVIEVLNKARITHESNVSDINNLYNYYKGKQDILYRVKTIRPEICNKIVENRAYEIVTFKTGYLVGEPIVYINRNNREGYSDEVNKLNEYMYLEGKRKKDRVLAEWMHIAGTAYRLALPRQSYGENDAPFEVYTIPPKEGFIIYSSGLDNKRMAGVKITVTAENKTIYSVWTDKYYYEVTYTLNDDETESAVVSNYTELKIEGKPPQKVKGQPTFYGIVPMVEYPLNEARLGAFEVVLTLIDAINQVESDRIDGIDQFIQSLMVFCNCDIDKETFQELKEEGALTFSSDSSNPASVEILTQELNQMQTQTLIDWMYETILTICGMPNRNGGNSTSDTGSAVIMRDGWSAAEARAKDTENMFEDSEKEFLKIILTYLKDTLKLPLGTVAPRFTRKNYEDVSTKVNNLIAMLNNPRIHPELAFTISNLFADGEAAWSKSESYYQEQLNSKQTAMLRELNIENNNG